MAEVEGKTRDRPLHSRYRELIADSPDQLLKLVEGLFGQAFYFRGQADADWKLATTLERRYGGVASYHEEHRILLEFQRRARAYTDDLPPENDQIEWLAFLRHLGGPTRLLDFTKSVYIAAFFAVSLSDGQGDAAIWAINRGALAKGATHFLVENQNADSPFADVLNRHAVWVTATDKTMEMKWPVVFNSAAATGISDEVSDRAVFPVEPRRLNRRMQSQQTIFLAPSNVGDSFMRNLGAILDPAVTLDATPNPESLADQNLRDMYSYDAVLKVIIPCKAFRRFHTALREMNLSEATLFPDLEGLIRSLVPISREFGTSFTRTQ